MKSFLLIALIMALGAEVEEFGTKEAMADDQKVAEVYAKKGAKIADLDDKIVDKWRAIARETAWKDYADVTGNPGGPFNITLKGGAVTSKLAFVNLAQLTARSAPSSPQP